ncbi:RNA helicase domain-containing protein [Bifidobacterium scaligerum]|uniref:Helicase superfamily 3 single-stranded DNA/RNA virus domain-containing protein n=1 Tax=Bifidobacterium scaligerum TaxID=2052656 RepID=A0A2M9HNZ4_9BIFI|nr:RNA helicase domain-containing protein [Bifidobacterium scaligerum]PJM78553.1 hypothetical protein CUU80_08900 [Bifidobacterium scaligerum]
MGFHEEYDPSFKFTTFNNCFFTLNDVGSNLGTEDPREIESILVERLKNYRYAIQLEKGEKSGILHLQGVIANDTRVRGTTIENKLHGVTLFKCRSVAGSYYYCTKEKTRVAGPWIHEPLKTKRKNDDGKTFTWNDLVNPKWNYDQWKSADDKHAEQDNYSKGRRRDLKILYSAIMKEGMTLNQVDNDPELSIIAGQFPAYAARLDRKKITDKFEKYKSIKTERDVKITWIYGDPGCGKTSLAKKLAIEVADDDVYMTETSEGNPWSEYEGQDAVIFDEFYGEVQFSKLMRWFDRYALKLSARYYDRWACYHHVFITSNLAPWDMYQGMNRRMERIGGFYRRIGKVIHFVKNDDGSYSQVDETESLLNRPDDIRSHDQHGVTLGNKVVENPDTDPVVLASELF